MNAQQSPCLAAAEMLAYLAGELPQGRRAEIERHLDECRLCEAAVEGVAGLEWRDSYLRSTDVLLARIRTRTAATTMAAAGARRSAPRWRPAPRYLTLAATLALAVGAAIILSRPGPGEALFQRHFEPYPSTRPVVRGVSTSGGSNALALYEARDYRGALAALEDTLAREPDDALAHFYAGLCRLNLGQLREANTDLEQVLRLGDLELHAPAEWYLALIHLRGGDPLEARPHLERIAAAGGFYRDKARTLLSELASLEKRN